MNRIISAENISFRYYDSVPLLTDFNFVIEENSFSALIGPNGSGKTTIFKILTGYIAPQSGNVMFRDRKLKAIPLRERARRIAVVPQNIVPALPYTVRQLVEMGRISRISRFALPTRQDRERVEYSMELMDITHLRNKLFSHLSGGEQQRTVIATALAQEPEVLMLDEPTAFLDLGHSNALMALLKKLNRENNLTIMIISHDIQLAAHYCSRLTLLKDGKIIADSAPADVIKPELIEQAYGLKVNVVCGADDNLMIAPVLKD